MRRGELREPAANDEPESSAGEAGPQEAKPGEWPTWRGPNRDGISPETGLLTEWPADGPPLLWTANGIGTGS